MADVAKDPDLLREALRVVVDAYIGAREVEVSYDELEACRLLLERRCNPAAAKRGIAKLQKRVEQRDARALEREEGAGRG